MGDGWKRRRAQRYRSYDEARSALTTIPASSPPATKRTMPNAKPTAYPIDAQDEAPPAPVKRRPIRKKKAAPKATPAAPPAQ